MPSLKILGRSLALAWHLGRAALTLAFRLAAARLARRGRSRQRIVGRTLAELFEALGPTYIKLGQILSTRRDILSETVARELARLQDQLPPIPARTLPKLFRREFGMGIEDVFAELDPSPVASASVASVYRARLRDGRLVAVKVLRPGVRARVRADLRLLRWLSGLLGRLPPLRRLPLRPALEEFGLCLERQLDFRLEAEANARVRACLAWEPDVSAPALVEEWCSPSVLTMQFIEGLRGTRPAGDRPERAALGAALRALYRMIFVEGFIHCDLHRGNLHFLPGGRAVLIDFGFMAALERAERLKFAEFFFAMATDDGARCARIIRETASFSPPGLDYEAFAAEIGTLVGGISGAEAGRFQVAGFALELFKVQRRHGIVGTTAFVMAIISLLVFEGLAKEFYPELDFQREALPFILRASIHRIDREPVTSPESHPSVELPDAAGPLTSEAPRAYTGAA
jgi:ubiquinone biosynthesis protein